MQELGSSGALGKAERRIGGCCICHKVLLLHTQKQIKYSCIFSKPESLLVENHDVKCRKANEKSINAFANCA